MGDTVLSALKLFLKGKLFREPVAAFKRWLLGSFISLTMLIVLAKLSMPLWLAVIIVSFGVGALQPYLFRDIKYD